MKPWDGKTDSSGKIIQDGDIIELNAKFSVTGKPVRIVAKIKNGEGNWQTQDLDSTAWTIVGNIN